EWRRENLLWSAVLLYTPPKTASRQIHGPGIHIPCRTVPSRRGFGDRGSFATSSNVGLEPCFERSNTGLVDHLGQNLVPRGHSVHGGRRNVQFIFHLPDIKVDG